MLIGFFRQGSCVSLNNAAVNSATCSFLIHQMAKKLLNAGFLGVVHISLIFAYGMQFILYGLGDVLSSNGGQIFLPGDRDIRRFRGFFGGSPFRLSLSAVSLPARRELLLRHFGLDRIKPGISRIVSAVLHLIFGNIQENLHPSKLGHASQVVGDRPPRPQRRLWSKYRSGYLALVRLGRQGGVKSHNRFWPVTVG